MSKTLHSSSVSLALGALSIFVAWFTAGGCAKSAGNDLGGVGGAGGGGAQTTSTGATTSSSMSGGCSACVTDQDCVATSKCVQVAGDTYCMPSCAQAPCSDPATACTTLVGAEGAQLQVCVPKMNICSGGSGAGGAGPSTVSSTAAGMGGAPATSSGTGMPSEVCGTLLGPDLASCCTSCTPGQGTCAANGCYGGWWCNSDTCKCQQAPNPNSCGGSTAASSTAASSGSTTASSSSSSGSGGGSIGPNGGTIGTLSFAIVGDTRPASEDDTAAYPTAVIQKIWQDVQAVSPRPAFAVSTGDYQFAKPTGVQSAPQLDQYLSARAAFTNIAFPAMGNHECTGATDSNCGQGNADGITTNYTTFLSKMLAPIGQSLPYFVIDVNGPANAWTAKFIFVAANAWSSAQSTWLSAAMAKPTTYTFVVRHEGSIANTAPGVNPSAAIMAQHPYTLLVAGHTHTYEYFSNEKQIIVGNGGAPLSGNINYGYVIGAQRADGAIAFKSYDYSTNAVIDSFAVKADGTPTP